MVSGPNKGDWPQSLWDYPLPDTNTTINLADEGLSDGDRINDYWNLSDNTRIEIPAGEYIYDPGSSERLRGTYSDLDIVGLGDPGDVRLRFPGGEADTREVNLACDGGTLRLKNLWFPDPGDDESSRIRLEADTTSAEVVCEHLWTTGGSTNDSPRSNGIYAGSDDHVGTLRLLWCWVEGRNNNGLYADGYAGSNRGQVIVVGGLYINNNIAQIRLGNDDSVAYRATVVHQGEDAMDLPSGRSDNGRGIRIRQAGDDLVIDSCDIHYSDQGGGVNYAPFVFHDGASGGSGILTNTRIYTESSNDAVQDKGGGGNWEAIDCHITGPGNRDIEISHTGTCSGTGCDIAHDETDAWFGEEVEGGVGSPGDSPDEGGDPTQPPAETGPFQWPRKYTGEVDDFETRGLLDCYTVQRGDATAFRRITPDIWTGSSAGSLGGTLRPAGEGQHMEIQPGGSTHVIESFPGDGLYWYPERGTTHSFYYGDNRPSSGSTPDWSIRFFLEEGAGSDHDGYSLHYNDGTVELREYINGSAGATLDSDSSGFTRPSGGWVYAEIQSTATTIDVDIYETDGHPNWEKTGSPVASLSVTDDRFNGRGIEIRGSGATDDRLWFDEWMTDVDPPTLITNFEGLTTSDLDTLYDLDTNLTGSAEPTLLEDWEDIGTDGSNLEGTGYNGDLDDWIIILGQFYDSGQYVPGANTSYVQLASDLGTTQDDMTYVTRMMMTESNDASGFLIHVQQPNDPNAECYAIRLDHRDDIVEIQDRGATVSETQESYNVELGQVYELHLHHDSSTDVLTGEVYEVDRGTTGPLTDATPDADLTLSTSTYSSGAWGYHGGRSGLASFDNVYEVDPTATGGATAQVFQITTNIWSEGTQSIQYRGTRSASDGYELLYGMPPTGLVADETTNLRGHYHIANLSNVAGQFRWALDPANPNSVYYALEIDADTGTLRLYANPSGEAEELLDEQDFALEQQWWLQFRIQPGETAEDMYVEVQTDEFGEELISLEGSHSAASPTFGDGIGWRGLDTGLISFDEFYIPGTTAQPNYVQDIDWAIGDDEATDSPTDPGDPGDEPDPGDPGDEPDPEEPTDPFVAWSRHRQLTGGRGRFRGLTWNPDESTIAAGGVGDTTVGGDLFVYETTGLWNELHDLPQADHLIDIAYSPDSRWLAVPIIDDTLRIYDASNHTVERTIPSSAHAGGLSAVGWRPDGDQLIVGSRTGFFYVYDTSSSDPGDWAVDDVLDHSGLAGDAGARRVKYSADGEYVALVIREYGVVVYEVGDWGSPLTDFTDQGATTRGVAWHPDTTEIAYTGDTGDVIVRSTSNWAETHRLERPDDVTQHVDYAPNGRWLACTQRDLGPNGWTRGHVWERTDDGFSYILPLNDRSIRPWDIKFHPESSFLAVSYDDGVVNVYNAPKDTKVRLDATASLDTVLQRANERSGAIDMVAEATMQTGEPEVTGKALWHLNFDGETVVADDRSPATVPTWQPGETITFTAVFDANSTVSLPAELRYRRLQKYQDVNHGEAIRTFSSYLASPRFDERIPDEAPFNSLLVAITPGAGIPGNPRGAWGLLTGMDDRSLTFDTGVWVVDLDILVLASPQNEYATHDDVREALGVRGMESEIQ